MKKIVSTVLVLFLCLSFSYTATVERTVKSGSVGVTFAVNNYINLRYFQDAKKTVPIDISKRIILEEGAFVYIEYQVSSESIFKPKGFRISEYTATGERLNNNSYTRDLNIITIPRDIFSGEISIEPIGEYEMRMISLYDSADGVELKGNWTINDTSGFSSPSGQINPLISYNVSYKYDSIKYYSISAEPAKKVISVNDGMVLFYVENPDTDGQNNLTTAYSIKLKPYTFLSFDKTSNVGSIIGPAGETLQAKDISSHRFKSGDTVTITTMRDYKIDCKGAVVKQTQLIENARTFILTVPEDTIDYALNISVIKQNAKDVAIKLPEIEKDGENPIITITHNKDSFSFDQMKKKEKITIFEGDILYISFGKPSNNQRVYLTVEGEDTSKLPDKYEIIDNESFQYPYSDISSIKVDIDEGYRFIGIIDNDKRLNITYVANGDVITNGQFLTSGTVVNIYVGAHEDLKTKGEHISSGADEGSLVIKNTTMRQDFIIRAEDIAGFYFDPSNYKDEHGTIVFSLDGGRIGSRKFIENGKIITYEGTSPDPGYRLPVKSGGNRITVDGKYNTTLLLKELKFVENGQEVVSLPRPEYGGTIIYRYKGQEILEDNKVGNVGDEISIEYKNWDWWNSNPNNKKNYIISETSNQSVPLLQDVFIELEEHKPELTVIIAKNVGENFELDLSELGLAKTPPRILKYVETTTGNFLNKNTDFSKGLGKIGTHKPLKITLKNYSLNKNEAIKIEWTETEKDGKSSINNSYTQKPDYEFIRDLTEHVPYISIKFERVTAHSFSTKSVANATVEIKNAQGDPLKAGHDIVEPDSNITVKITPDYNYYVTGKDVIKDVYVKTMTYGSYLENINSILSDHSVNKYYSLSLNYEDVYGTSNYKLNNKKINSQKVQFKEGDVLAISYELTASEYSIDSLYSWIPFVGRIASGTIKLVSAYDGSTISRSDFGIHIKEND